MRTSTTGRLLRVDTGPVLDLLPALWAEWDELRFDDNGRVVDPLTGTARPHLQLVEGQHGRPGASYLVTPPPSDDNGSKDEDQDKDDEAPPPFLAVLGNVDRGRARARLSSVDDTWTADVVVDRGRTPRAEVGATVDLAGLLRQGATPGCLAGLVGRRARVEATVDVATLVERSRADTVTVTVRTRRLRGAATLRARPTGDAWEVDGTLSVTGRGLGRLAVAVVGGRLRRAVDDEAARFWAEEAGTWSRDRRAEVTALAEAVATEGGARPFVRRALWDPTHDLPLNATDGVDGADRRGRTPPCPVAAGVAPMGELDHPVVVGFPLRGEWTVERTPAERIPSHGTDLLGMRYAYDFIRTDDRPGRHVHPASTLRWVLVGGRTQDCYGWGQPVHAAATGEVVDAVDGVAERRRVHVVREAWAALCTTLSTARRVRRGQPVDPARLAGNHVIVRSGTVHAVYAHLAPGTVMVAVGERVGAGDVLGRVGHSGNSTAPHLHFHLMGSADPQRALGIPCAFAGYEVRRGGRWEPVAAAIPGPSERVRVGPG